MEYSIPCGDKQEVYFKIDRRMKTKNWQSLPKDLEIIKVTNFKEIEAIRPIWEEMQNNEPYPIINTEIDKYISVIKAHEEKVQPYIILIKHNGNPISMIIGRLERRRLNLRLGYMTLFNPTLRCLSVVYGGIIGEASKDIHILQICQLMEILRNGEVDMVFFNQLRVDSQIYQLAQTMPGFMCRNHFPRIDPHWVMSVPDNMQLFYKSCSKNNRKQFKKCLRRIAKEFPGRVIRVSYTREDQMDEAIPIVDQISSKTYQNRLGVGFVDNAKNRSLLTTAARKGWLRLNVLFVDGEPCAFEIWLQFGKTYFGNGIGFDPKWKKLRVGTVLFLKTLDCICTDPTVHLVDFGFGDSEYKQIYCDKQWSEASVYIYAPKIYPILINMLQSAINVLSLGLAYIAKKADFTRWIKRCWRNRLQNINAKGQC